jgi:uncharacterized protein YukE
MADELAGIEEDVRFNWEAADTLERELRSGAGTLDGQVPQRNAYSGEAQQEWRGVYSVQFANRMEICTSDARRLSGAMQLAANQVRELAEAARREQQRREAAREWKRQQDDETVLEEAVEYATFGIFADDEAPPIPPPEPPPRFVSPEPPARARG